MDNNELMNHLKEGDTRELYALLGAQLLGDGFQVGAEDEAQNHRFGKAWFEERIDVLRSAICDTPLVKAVGGDFNSDVTALAAVLLPISSNNQLLALTLSAIVLRRGVSAFCAVEQA